LLHTSFNLHTGVHAASIAHRSLRNSRRSLRSNTISFRFDALEHTKE
jgi:hypothetical protein